MTPAELALWVEATAAELLSPLGDRWRHVQGVADQAREVSRILPPGDRPYLVAAGYLHDVGYAPSLAAVTAFHPLDGAFWLHQRGQQRLARLVAYHSSARFETAARGLGHALAAFTPEHSPTADALTYCDMTTSPKGARDAAGAVVRVRMRYGAGHLAARSLQEAHQHLAGAVARTQRRLRDAGVA